MCVKLNSFFDREMKVHYVTQVLKQGINIKPMCPNYILELRRDTKSQPLKFRYYDPSSKMLDDFVPCYYNRVAVNCQAPPDESPYITHFGRYIHCIHR